MAGLQPPRNDGKYAALYARLHTGAQVGIPRLKLTPYKDGRDTWVPHLDVALVLERYVMWCHRHGRRP